MSPRDEGRTKARSECQRGLHRANGGYLINRGERGFRAIGSRADLRNRVEIYSDVISRTRTAAPMRQGMRYSGTRATFALSIIPVGITMTMTAITIAVIGRDAAKRRGAGTPSGWGASIRTRRAGRQLGKLLTNNTAGDNDTGCRPRPRRPNRPSSSRTITREIQPRESRLGETSRSGGKQLDHRDVEETRALFASMERKKRRSRLRLHLRYETLLRFV